MPSQHEKPIRSPELLSLQAAVDEVADCLVRKTLLSAPAKHLLSSASGADLAKLDSGYFSITVDLKTFISQKESALALYNAGHTELAEKTFLRAVHLGKRIFGPEHPELEVLYRAYSVLLSDLERNEESEAYERMAELSIG